MPSFDIVSETNMQEVDNAINQAVKEIATRFDFKGGRNTIELDKEAKIVKIIADDDMKLRAIHQLIEQKLAKRGVDLGCLDFGDHEEASGQTIRQKITIKSGIDKESAKKIVKSIKDSKLKVQAQIQDEQVRVSGKKIDDLQEVIALLKQNSPGIPLQYINMRA